MNRRLNAGIDIIPDAYPTISPSRSATMATQSGSRTCAMKS